MNQRRLVTATAFLALAVPQPAGAVEFSDPTAIDNRYLPLSKFERCELRGRDEGERLRVVRTLLDRTREFRHAGRRVRAAVVEDREFANGKLVERTFDYFAQDDGGTVYYLGEHVDHYENGKVVGHDGSWLYGRDTEHMGVAMPARPRVGSRWRNENVPGITVERDEAVAILDEVAVRGKTYRDVLKVRERADGETEFKLYAPGVGNISERPPDGRVGLVGCRREETR
jgi:hypothetical protein